MLADAERINSDLVGQFDLRRGEASAAPQIF